MRIGIGTQQPAPFETLPGSAPCKLVEQCIDMSDDCISAACGVKHLVILPHIRFATASCVSRLRTVLSALIAPP
jgi:hypothetical protein